MSRFLSVILLLVVLGVCLGFLRGWFTLTSNKEPISGKRDIHLQVDSDKLQMDVNAVEGKTKALFGPENDAGH